MKKRIDDPFEYHKRQIAKKTMTYHCSACFILGGMNHHDAARILAVKIPDDCTCERSVRND